jgi:hypothetical protein
MALSEDGCEVCVGTVKVLRVLRRDAVVEVVNFPVVWRSRKNCATTG